MGPLPTTLALVGLVVVAVAMGQQEASSERATFGTIAGFVFLAIIAAIGVYERVW